MHSFCKYFVLFSAAARTIGGQEMTYGRTVNKALYWAGIKQDEWFALAENKFFWGKLTHGEWNGSAGIYEREKKQEEQ